MTMEADMKVRRNVIGGIAVELETWVEAGEPRSSLFLLAVDTDGSRYQGSLHLSEHLGGIPYDKGGPDDGPELYPVSRRRLEEIEEWAVKHGY